MERLQRADSYKRLVEFNALRASEASRRWRKLKLAVQTASTFRTPLRQQIEVERVAAAAARGRAEELGVRPGMRVVDVDGALCEEHEATVALLRDHKRPLAVRLRGKGVAAF